MSRWVLRLAADRYRGAIQRRRAHFPGRDVTPVVQTFEALQRCALNRSAGALVRYWWREWRSVRMLDQSRAEETRVRVMNLSTSDIRHAWRSLVRARAYSLTVLLTLALGIGVNAAIFSVVDGALLKPLPYEDPDALVAVAELPPSGIRNSVAPLSFLEWREGSKAFTGLAARQATSFLMLDGGDPEEARGARVSTSYFDVLAVRPSHGRAFVDSDGQPGAACVVMLSDRLWARRWSRDPTILGRAVRLATGPCEVIGVLPPDSVFDRVPFQMYSPLTFTRAQAPRGHFLTVIGRLRPGVTVAQANADLDALARSINATNPSKTEWLTRVDPWRSVIVRADSRQLVLVLFGAVGVVLLVACVNVASLALSRAVTMRREVSIRRALGAGVGRLFGLYLTESTMIAAAGGLLGVLAGHWCLQAILALMPPGTLPTEAPVTMDWRVMLFTAALVALVSLIVGSVPAWQTLRVNASNALRSGSRGATLTMATRRVQSGLLVAQVALAMVLVTGAALLGVSFARLTSVNPGFDSVGAQTFRLAMLRDGTPAQAAQFHEAVLAELRQVAGVETAGAGSSLPLRGWLFGTTVRVQGEPLLDPTRRNVHLQHVAGDYFGTLRMPMRDGRPLGLSEGASTARVAVVNETFVRRFLGDRQAVGRHLILGASQDQSGGNAVTWEVVGVVRDVKTGGLADAELLTPEVYVSHTQAPQPVLQYVVRSKDPSGAVAVADLRQAIHRVSAETPLGPVISLTEMIGDSVVGQRFRTALVMAFALVTLLVAAVGVYAVRAQAVNARRREVGIRLALGATPRQILGLVVGQGFRLVGAGVAIGLAAAYAAAGAIEQWLFRVSVTDVMPVLLATAVLGGAALSASWLPARQAARVQPVETLRQE